MDVMGSPVTSYENNVQPITSYENNIYLSVIYINIMLSYFLLVVVVLVRANTIDNKECYGE